MTDKLIIANCSGFYGDRLSAAKQMVTGGPIDVLTGDYLAELTMAILFRKTLKDPNQGYAATFVKQMEQVMATCLEKNIRVVANAGGLSPKGLAMELQKIADELGLAPKIAYIEGDNLMPRLNDLKEKNEALSHLEHGESLFANEHQVVTANAYMGGWGITKALTEGADIVVTGRVADAALVSGPAAWKFGWSKEDWDALAGAIVAGHIIECGTQATGGNYSFMDEIKSFDNVGFPFAEIYSDGSCVIGKHENTGGVVSEGTVKAQLLYEIESETYYTPDVTAKFDTINLEQVSENLVRVSGVKGAPPPESLKVCVNRLAGYKNSARFVITGLDIEKKAELIETTLFNILGGKDRYDEVLVHLQTTCQYDPMSNEDAFSYLRVAVKSSDQKLAGKFFSAACIELALSNIPGFSMTEMPGNGVPAIAHWPALIARSQITQEVTLGENLYELSENGIATVDVAQKNANSDYTKAADDTAEDYYSGNSILVPMGRIFGTRSGDKGGNANLGVWCRNSAGYPFLRTFLTVDTLKMLIPDLKAYEIIRYEFPNLLAVNFYIKGVLGEGVASSLKADPQAKTLGEYVRLKKIHVPEELVESTWAEYT